MHLTRVRLLWVEEKRCARCVCVCFEQDNPHGPRSLAHQQETLPVRGVPVFLCVWGKQDNPQGPSPPAHQRKTLPQGAASGMLSQ